MLKIRKSDEQLLDSDINRQFKLMTEKTIIKGLKITEITSILAKVDHQITISLNHSGGTCFLNISLACISLRKAIKNFHIFQRANYKII